jgi:hypothetical protein
MFFYIPKATQDKRGMLSAGSRLDRHTEEKPAPALRRYGITKYEITEQ